MTAGVTLDPLDVRDISYHSLKFTSSEMALINKQQLKKYYTELHEMSYIYVLFAHIKVM